MKCVMTFVVCWKHELYWGTYLVFCTFSLFIIVRLFAKLCIIPNRQCVIESNGRSRHFKYPWYVDLFDVVFTRIRRNCRRFYYACHHECTHIQTWWTSKIFYFIVLSQKGAPEQKFVTVWMLFQQHNYLFDFTSNYSYDLSKIIIKIHGFLTSKLKSRRYRNKIKRKKFRICVSKRMGGRW